MPTMTTRRCVVSPSTTEICSDRCSTSYPTPRRPYEPEERQVLAQLRRGDARAGGQLLRRRGHHAVGRQPVQDPQVARQPGDRGGGHVARAGPPGRTRLRCPGVRPGSPPLRVHIDSRERPVGPGRPGPARQARGRGPRRGKGSAQPVRVDPPVALLDAVDLDHRDQLAQLVDEVAARRRVRVDVDLRPVGAGLRADRPHHLPRLVAQMAAGPAVEHHTRHGLTVSATHVPPGSPSLQ